MPSRPKSLPPGFFRGSDESSLRLLDHQEEGEEPIKSPKSPVPKKPMKPKNYTLNYLLLQQEQEDMYAELTSPEPALHDPTSQFGDSLSTYHDEEPLVDLPHYYPGFREPLVDIAECDSSAAGSPVGSPLLRKGRKKSKKLKKKISKLMNSEEVETLLGVSRPSGNHGNLTVSRSSSVSGCPTKERKPSRASRPSLPEPFPYTTSTPSLPEPFASDPTRVATLNRLQSISLCSCSHNQCSCMS